MHDAVDDRADAAARPPARWPAEDGSSYAVRSGRRTRWLLPALAVAVGLLLGAAAVVLISLH